MPRMETVTTAAKYSAIIDEQQGAGLVAWDVGTGKPAVILNLEKTAAIMLTRSTRRRANGHYKRKTRKAQILGIALTVIAFLSLIGAGVSILFPKSPNTSNVDNPDASLTVEQRSSLAVVIAFVFILIFVIKLSLLAQWYFYALALAVVILLIINKGQLTPSNIGNPSATGLSVLFNKDTGPTFIVLICLLAVQFLTLIATLWRRVLYPRVVGKFSHAAAVRWWWVRPISLQPGTFQYTIYDPWSFSNDNRTFSYTGSVNSAGLPHGYGMWCDDCDSGEVTTGYWKNGSPVPPFTAREFGSGDSFAAVKIAYVTCSKLGMNEYKAIPKADEKGIRYGVAGVECSVSGKFFAELPQVSQCFPAQYRDQLAARHSHDMEPGSPLQILDPLFEELKIGEFARAPIPSESYSKSSASSPNHGSSPPLAPRPGYESLRYRVATKEPVAAECSPKHCDSALSRVVIHIDHKSDELSVEGFRRVRQRGGLDSDKLDGLSSITIKAIKTESDRVLSVDGWERVDNICGSPPGVSATEWSGSGGYTDRAHEDEALVFIHGYNCSMEAAIKRFGQLMTLGDFPAWIKPFVFGWPSGQELSYLLAIKAAYNPMVQQAFRQFIQDLAASGIRKVHLLNHSAGCTLAVGFADLFGDIFHQIMEDEGPLSSEFSAGDRESSQQAPKPRLCTFTLINADISLAKFLDTNYAKIRHYCDLITCYVDEHDGALFWLEGLFRKKVLGRNPALIYTVVPKEDDVHEDVHLGEPENLRDTSGPDPEKRRSRVRSVSSSDIFSGGNDSSEAIMLRDLDRRAASPMMLPKTRTSGFLQLKHPWQENRKARGNRLKFMLLSRFEYLLHPGTTPGASHTHSESTFERKYGQVQEDVQKEIERLQSLMRGREKYAKELTDDTSFRGFRGNPNKYLIYPDMGAFCVLTINAFTDD
ncbi:hypothetical protein DFJ77DRAFT_258394 [Powellomyces hirtus]|nr:hypothetical protein DFJ77DRAFT_258394 [Powellomyces hirtus]